MAVPPAADRQYDSIKAVQRFILTQHAQQLCSQSTVKQCNGMMLPGAAEQATVTRLPSDTAGCSRTTRSGCKLYEPLFSCIKAQGMCQATSGSSICHIHGRCPTATQTQATCPSNYNHPPPAQPALPVPEHNARCSQFNLPAQNHAPAKPQPPPPVTHRKQYTHRCLFRHKTLTHTAHRTTPAADHDLASLSSITCALPLPQTPGSKWGRSCACSRGR